MPLNDISFCETDTAKIKDAVLSAYEEAAGRQLADGDPVRLFLLSVAAVIVQQRELIDWSAKQNLLAYASGDYLDHLGALLGVSRLTDTPAVTTLEFRLSTALMFPVLVPAGTRATHDGQTWFATDENAVVPTGQESVRVGATCMTSGADFNGLQPGQINEIVDPMPYVESVVNVTATTGGASTENDDAFRARINLAPESFSVAGPSGAYAYHAMSVNPSIVDVAVVGPQEEPGNVYVYPLLSGGQVPSAEVISQVAEALNDEKVRPLSDHVFVQAPQTRTYHTALTWYLERSAGTSSAAVQKAVQAAVADYELWQRSKLGRDINPSELIRRVMAAGALRVVVDSPLHTVLAANELAPSDADAEITFGGIEDG